VEGPDHLLGIRHAPPSPFGKVGSPLGWAASYSVMSKKRSMSAALVHTGCDPFLLHGNPVVVIILAPLFIDIAEKLKSNLFVYLVGLAISSNVVTTVTMVADPPALIVAAKTGMQFLDFYWFQGKVGLGTISVFGLIAALLVLLYRFRHMNNQVDCLEENVEIKKPHPVNHLRCQRVLLSLPIMTAGILW